MTRRALLLLFTIATSWVSAQNNTIKCSESYVEHTFDEFYGAGSYQELLHEISEEPIIAEPTNTEGTIYTIPVVVHVMYDDDQSNITRQQVLDALRILNRDYRKQNADTVNTRPIFKNDAADVEVEFVLAKKDPQGNCTEGITRTQTNLTNNANNTIKPLINWPNNRYLNIWVVKSINVPGQPGNIVLGYSYLPVPGGNNFILDGVVIRNDQMGTIGTATNGGRTLTHEVGHYLGLNHPFNGGCFSGDGFSDTPPAASENFGCNPNRNSCSNDPRPDQIENYMDYADDDCTNMFTNQQASRMRNRTSSATYRGNLVSSSNHDFTGITPGMALPCAPVSEFATEETVVCVGTTVQFTDESSFGNPTSYSWSFPGGTPSSSTSPNPTVSYNQPGNFAVNLTTTNANGSSTKQKAGFISVRSQAYTPHVGSFVGDFETGILPSSDWHVKGGIDTVNFRRYTNTAYNGQACATLQNFHALRLESDVNNPMRDELVSQTIDLKYTTDATLTYKYAFAEVAFGNTDVLRIYLSDDCGITWTQIGQRLGPTLRTTSTRHTSSWQPSGMNEWKTGTIDLSAYANNPSFIMLKFEFENGGGNNFYLDDITVSSTVGDDEFVTNQSIRMYPNPTRDMLHIDGAPAISEITVIDLTGRMVIQRTTKQDDVTLSLETLAKGMYLVEVRNGSEKFTEKIIVE